MSRKSVRQLVDRLEITQNLHLHCRSMNRLDHEIGYKIWNDDAVVDCGANIYQGSGIGYVDYCLDKIKDVVGHCHQITNIVIEIDGDRAATEACVHSTSRILIGGKPKKLTTWARYLDEWSRKRGKWGIDERVAVRDLDEISDCTPYSDDDRVSRDRHDPSYKLFSRALGEPIPFLDDNAKDWHTVRPDRAVRGSRRGLWHGDQRERVIEAATEAFLEHGYAHVNLSGIAKSAGVDFRRVKTNYSSKYLLFRDVILALHSAHHIKLPQMVPGVDATEALTGLVSLIQAGKFNPHALVIRRLQMTERTRFPELMSELGVAGNESVKRVVRSVIEQLVVGGSMVPTNCERAAELFIDLFFGISTLELFYGSSEGGASRTVSRERVDFFLKCLAP